MVVSFLLSAVQNAPEHTSLKKVVADNSNFVYVSEQFELSNSALEAFFNMFACFQLLLDENTDEKASALVKGEVIYSDNDMESGKDPDEEKKSLSKKKQHKLVQPMVVELKQLIKKPEVIEWMDVITANPPPPPCQQTPNAVWHGNAFGRGQCRLYHYAGPQSLYQVVPEKQTLVWGLMGSKRGYNISAVLSAPLPVLGDKQGTKVRWLCLIWVDAED
ncbi:hypothetical protein C0993_011343 [Termitomyces sp. T159_Od127]|nr:hypothetical protein C0993_011343 [Termitomyces sp. T159_Od127]